MAWRDRASASLVLAVCATGLFYLVKGISPPVRALALLALGLVCSLAVALVLGGNRFALWVKRRFPPRPLWEKPRPVSALFERELFEQLFKRLDLLEREDQASLWRDRESGQLWSAFAWDYEHTAETTFTPLAERSQWLGMKGQAPQAQAVDRASQSQKTRS